MKWLKMRWEELSAFFFEPNCWWELKRMWNSFGFSSCHFSSSHSLNANRCRCPPHLLLMPMMCTQLLRRRRKYGHHQHCHQSDHNNTNPNWHKGWQIILPSQRDSHHLLPSPVKVRVWETKEKKMLNFKLFFQLGVRCKKFYWFAVFCCFRPICDYCRRRTCSSKFLPLEEKKQN